MIPTPTMYLALYNTTTKANVLRHWAKLDGTPRCGAPLGVDTFLFDAAEGDMECRRCTRLGPVVRADATDLPRR